MTTICPLSSELDGKFIYRGKQYPFSTQTFKIYSLKFNNEFFPNSEIHLNHDDFAEEAIISFIAAVTCQNFDVTHESFLQISVLADEWQVEGLKNYLGDWIKSNNNLDQLIEYERANANNEKAISIQILYEIDQKLAQNLIKLLRKSNFITLPVNVLCRIFQLWYQNSYLKMVSKKEKSNSMNLIFQFITKELENHKEFCILLQFINIEHLSKDNISKLLDIKDEEDSLYNPFNHLKFPDKYLSSIYNEVMKMFD